MQQETHPLGLNRNMIWKRTSKLKTEEDLYRLRMKTLKNSDDFARFIYNEEAGNIRFTKRKTDSWLI